MIMRAGKSSTKEAPAKKKSGFVYKARDPKTVRARAEQTSGQYDGIFRNGVDTWRAKNGENVIRFLPPSWHPHDHYGYDVWVHSYVGTGSGSYLCLDKMKEKRCPICEAAAECTEAGETEDAKKLKPTRRVLTWILDRDDDAANPQVYSMSWSMDRDISNLADNRRTGEVLTLDHPDEGFDVSFKRTGQGINTRYIGIAIDRESSPLSDRQKVQDRITSFVEENPLPDTLQYRSEEYLDKVIAGTAEEKDQDLDEDDDDGETKKGKKKSKPIARTKRRVKDEDEDEDEEIPFDTDEDEEEEKPRKSKRRSEEDEDEEEEKPRKSSKQKRDEDEDEEEEEEERPRKKSRRDEEEEDEDDKPVKSKSKRKPARDEEEDEDEDSETKDGEEDEEEESDESGSEDSEEEEEEDEKPRRRVKPKGRR